MTGMHQSGAWGPGKVALGAKGNGTEVNANWVFDRTGPAMGHERVLDMASQNLDLRRSRGESVASGEWRGSRGQGQGTGIGREEME